MRVSPAHGARMPPGSPPLVGIVCGLASERDAILRGLARAAGPPDLRVEVAVAGARPLRAGKLAARFAERGSALLVSAGLAGGLDPELTPGDIVWSTDVASLHVNDKILTLDTESAEQIDACPLPLGRWGRVVARDRPILTPEMKAAAYYRTNGLVVDMETGSVAGAAQMAGVPFLVMRVVIDAADAAIPSFMVGAITPQGKPAVRPLLAGLAARPWALRKVVSLARAAREAHAGLSDAAAELGPIALAVTERDAASARRRADETATFFAKLNASRLRD